VAENGLRILLVEDNPGDVRLVIEYLNDDRSSEFDVIHVDTVGAAVEALTADQHGFDAVLLDLSLPDEMGVGTLRRVIAAAGRTVVVVMTGVGDDEVGRTAMQEGAQDYLVKGQVNGALLRRALRYAIERQDLRLRLQDLSLTDDLTGLHNRRGFLILAEQQIKVARRNRTPFLLLFMDLDKLKKIHDTFRHSEGNRALVEAADVLRNCFRQSDLLSRLGGDDFAAFAMMTAGADEATIRRRLAETLDVVNQKPDRAYPLMFSVGVLACSPADDVPLESLLGEADKLMYSEKKQKRSQLS
jgi:diguanylate cyclase (GGDEF)-like protein